MKKFKLILADQFFFQTAEVFDRVNADNILQFLQEFDLLQEIPRSIRLHLARCQTGQHIKAFCNQNNIQLIEAPIHDHRAIGVVEKLIQTIKNCLACIKTAARNQFNERIDKFYYLSTTYMPSKDYKYITIWSTFLHKSKYPFK